MHIPWVASSASVLHREEIKKFGSFPVAVRLADTRYSRFSIDNLVVRAAAVKTTNVSSSAKVFSFSRKSCDDAIKAACSALQIPQGTSHSFRAGFMTDASAAGVPDSSIAQHTRHKSIVSLQSYKIPSISDLNVMTQLVSRVSRE